MNTSDSPEARAADAAVASRLVLQQIRAALEGHPIDLVRMAALAEAADRPGHPGAGTVLRGLTVLTGAYVDAPGYDVDNALIRADELAAELPPNSDFGHVLAALRHALLVKRAQARGDIGPAREAAAFARQLATKGGLDPVQAGLSEAMGIAGEAMDAVQRGDVDGAMRIAARLGPVLDRLPADHPGVAQMRQLADHARALYGDAPASGVDPLEVAATERGLAPGERAYRLHIWGTAQCQRALATQDASLFAAGINHLRDAFDTAPRGDPNRCLHLMTFGRMQCEFFRVVRDRRRLVEAIARLEEAVALAAHPGNPVWAMAALGLATAYRLDGRRADGRVWGLRSLRGNAWTVLLQSGPAAATAAARHAADEAVEVARWCFEDGEIEDGATALDAGRGLLLYASTVAVDLADRLVVAGRRDLADAWRRGTVDQSTGSQLRYETLTVLAGVDESALPTLADVAPPRLLDPPTMYEVRAALRTLDLDALIYLLPADEHGRGGAVLVPAQQPPIWLDMPALTRHAGDAIGRHADVLAPRTARVARPQANREPRRDTLGELSDWAWSAAVGPVLRELSGWRLGRAPRIAFVPYGVLATVPWHAARDGSGRYAVGLAVFSYTPSARLLCESAWRRPVPAGDGSLIVGDPTRDLAAARVEAFALRDRFYPSATLLGAAEDPDGLAPATPAAVLEHLRAGGRACPVLHLACHGAVEGGAAYLRLAADTRLAADRLLTEPGRAEIGVVGLAACTTGVPSGAFDEAFSLAAAFLVAGARTVFGSLWPVPSDSTSVLMYMAHHFLQADGLPAADALQKAQLWMLDPTRRVPADLPETLRRRVERIDVDDIAAWAGFTHLGR